VRHGKAGAAGISGINGEALTMKNVREWLESHKVFFETVTASLLSLMAIIVSCGQTIIAEKQTLLLGIQTQIAEAQALPQFEVSIRQRLNDATGKFDDNDLVVNNHGGPVHEFSADAAYFIHLDVGGRSGQVLKIEVPVQGYFTSSFVSVATTGQLVTMVGNHNNATVIALTGALRDKAHSRGFDYAILSEKIVLRMRYRDLLDRQHEDYFEVHPVSGGTRLQDGLGKARFSKWSTAQVIELSRLRADDLLDRVSPASVGRP
jgi:hypothetical protein